MKLFGKFFLMIYVCTVIFKDSLYCIELSFRRIISTLPESDLQNCEKVNSIWKDAVKAERQMAYRLRPETICWTGSTERRENVSTL